MKNNRRCYLNRFVGTIGQQIVGGWDSGRASTRFVSEQPLAGAQLLATLAAAVRPGRLRALRE